MKNVFYLFTTCKSATHCQAHFDCSRGGCCVFRLDYRRLVKEVDRSLKVF